jgi:hypothetical protein
MWLKNELHPTVYLNKTLNIKSSKSLNKKNRQILSFENTKNMSLMQIEFIFFVLKELVFSTFTT